MTYVVVQSLHVEVSFNESKTSVANVGSVQETQEVQNNKYRYDMKVDLSDQLLRSGSIEPKILI